jgi:sulfate/thiosulfate transport system ATP-binding protein
MEMPYPAGRRTDRGDATRIRLADIAKEFGTTAALHGVDLDIRPGELMALLGPSGSGKTTLLRVIAGLEIPDRGRVLFGELDATNLAVQHRGVGFVFQHYALFKHLTVFDNVAYGLRIRQRRQAADIARRVHDLLELMQLSGLERRFPAQLSGGQRQRAALARALAVEPRVLLLDEPFGALDAKVRKDLRRWLRDIHGQSGQTTVFVTHDQDEALELADRVAILNNGRIEQVGTPDEVHDQPASAFVMAFVGETTRVPVRIESGQLWCGGHRVALSTYGVSPGHADLFLRPWELELGSSAGLPGTVRATRRVGQIRRVEIALDDIAASVQVDAPAGKGFSQGDRVAVIIRGGRVFPAGSLAG